MLQRRFVLCVLTVWLATPVGRLACAVSCAQPPESAPMASHCHETPAAPSEGPQVTAGHACPDLGTAGLTATLKTRHIAQVAVLSVPLQPGLSTGRELNSPPTGAADLSRPPDGLLVPLRL